MTRSERFAWLRRDGAPLTLSLVLHVIALLLITPWLVMRTIPAPQVEVEVMLEPDTPERSHSRPEKAARLRAPVKAKRPLDKPLARLVQTQPMQTAQPQVQPPLSKAPATQPGQGQSGRSAPAPRETAGLSAPKNQAVQRAAAPLSPGTTALQDGSMQASPVAPRAPSLGSTPQPSALTAAAPSRPGEDRQDGPVTLAGPVPQAQAVQPEFRQAARQGGQASMRGGSQTPDDGLARQPGVPGQTALLAARAMPQAQPGSGLGLGGQPPALAAPVSRNSGQGGVVATESTSRSAQLATAGTGQGIPSVRPASGVSRSGQAPVLAAPAARGSGQGSVAAAESVSPGNLAQLVASSTGQGAPSASRAAAPSGQGSAGVGSGSRTVSPAERGNGLLAAATPGASGPGTAATGTGPGASVAGEGRAQQLVGTGSAARDSASPLLAAGGGAAAPAGADSSAGQLSGRAEGQALAQPVRETQAAPLQTQQPTGQARVIEERFTATALKVNSPRSICELPLMFAGFDRKPIPKGLDTINASEPMVGEIPPRHHPGNQAPRYPLLALPQFAAGRALVRAEIRPDGLVGQLWIKQPSGFPLLDQAALETVRSWRFYPAQRYGMAVAMWMDVPIEYTMPHQGVNR